MYQILHHEIENQIKRIKKLRLFKKDKNIRNLGKGSLINEINGLVFWIRENLINFNSHRYSIKILKIKQFLYLLETLIFGNNQFQNPSLRIC